MQRHPADHQPSSDAEVITHGPLVIDLAGFTVTVAGQDIPLTFSEFLLLKELASHPNRVVDRAALVAVLDTRSSGYHPVTSPVSLRTVDTHLSRVRTKLARAGYDCIKTMRFVGYRFLPVGAPEDDKSQTR